MTTPQRLWFFFVSNDVEIMDLNVSKGLQSTHTVQKLYMRVCAIRGVSILYDSIWHFAAEIISIVLVRVTSLWHYLGSHGYETSSLAPKSQFGDLFLISDLSFRFKYTFYSLASSSPFPSWVFKVSNRFNRPASALCAQRMYKDRQNFDYIAWDKNDDAEAESQMRLRRKDFCR